MRRDGGPAALPALGRSWRDEMDATRNCLAFCPVCCLSSVVKMLTANVGRPRGNRWQDAVLTGIDKPRSTAPSWSPHRTNTDGVGLAGDRIFFSDGHGGPDQAVYAYAREDLDMWEGRLRRPLANGVFGENLTTSGVDVNGALVGERWRIGRDVILEVSAPRIPCGTFQGWLAQDGWIKTFTSAALPGAYLRVTGEGHIRAGDPIELIYRPEHDVSIAVTFRALTLEPDLLPGLLAADALPEKIKDKVRKRIAGPPE